MSVSKVNVSASVIERAKNTHYAVSTFAAVVYALVWLLMNGAQAEPTEAKGETVLPAVVVTAYRTLLPEVVVVGKAPAAIATLDPIIVMGKRPLETERVAASGESGQAGVNVRASGSPNYVAKVRNWLRAAL